MEYSPIEKGKTGTKVVGQSYVPGDTKSRILDSDIPRHDMRGP